MTVVRILENLKKDPRFCEELKREIKESDPVLENIVYHRFVSKSKGWRKNKNGLRTKKRVRKIWKEVKLIHYSGGNLTGKKFNQWHLFPFDVHADEIFNRQCEPYELENRINEIYGY